MCAFFLSAGLIAFAEDEGKIIAVYGDAASVKNPPPGWGFLWNANGKGKTPESKILLHGIFPRGAGATDPKDETVRQTNAKIALLADKKKVFYLDVRTSLLEADGTISSEVMPDKLHPAKPGFDRWMNVLSPALNELLKN